MDEQNQAPAMPAAQPQQPVTEKDIMTTINLNLEQVNIILTAMNDLPHRVSREIIDSIRSQVIAQLNAKQSV